MDLTVSLGWLHEQEHGALKREYESQDTAGGVGLMNDLLYQHSPATDAASRGGGTGQGSEPLRGAVHRGGRPAHARFRPEQRLRGDSQPLRRREQLDHVPRRHPFWERDSARLGTAFRGPTRRGVEYLGLGANWAVFNQARDDTKPTWVLRFETRLSVADDMRFDPAAPRQTRPSAWLPPVHLFHVVLAAFRPAGTILGGLVRVAGADTEQPLYTRPA